ncbi:T9SS type A sorting domain-containing protein [Dysgonomonas sp. 520]|uniref:T9SS type A sorting domain-containing protein n=1 Tax=Dysgonomonas sp. 520 TaxID=2302931 RepID=UPI0013D13BC5|nr:T9SS type A sorting domain-containing protein [Dysgonomonas sp. 520]NDW08742.1 T9SS C-terminal target domain-containing protein [Dysgonomonas sp. 520]
MKKINFLLLFVVATVLNLSAQIPSEYCGYLIKPENNPKATAYITFETNSEGNIVISIAPYDGDNNTYFRNSGWVDGIINDITVDGDASGAPYFERTIGTPEDPDQAPQAHGSASQITLKPLATIAQGAKIVINGVLEYETSMDDNLWPTIKFEYTYGSNCQNVPAITTTVDAISFSPEQGVQTFKLSGENLTSDIVLAYSKGLTVTPSTITPESDGSITDKTITVKWEGGASNPYLNISGGGMLVNNNKDIDITATGFSEFCNKIISQGNNGTQFLAYATATTSSDLKTVTFDIAPYNENENTRWANSGYLLNNVKINGVDATGNYQKEYGETSTSLVFNSPLQKGDVLTVEGAAFVWQIYNATTGDAIETNAFIDPIQSYTVGCDCKADTTTGIANAVSNTEVKIYPNPAVDTVYVEGDVNEIAIFSLQGQQVLTNSKTNTVDVSGLASGLYIVRVIDGSGAQSSAKLQVK